MKNYFVNLDSLLSTLQEYLSNGTETSPTTTRGTNSVPLLMQKTLPEVCSHRNENENTKEVKRKIKAWNSWWSKSKIKINFVIIVYHCWEVSFLNIILILSNFNHIWSNIWLCCYSTGFRYQDEYCKAPSSRGDKAYGHLCEMRKFNLTASRDCNY